MFIIHHISSHIYIEELDHKGSWVLKNWCHWINGVGENSWDLWTVRRSNQFILKEISPEYSLEGLMLKLKLQSFGPLIEELTHWKRPWCWERLKAGGEGDDRVWDWMASPTQWTCVWVNSRSWWWTWRTGVLQSLGWQRVRQDWVTELNWTESSLLQIAKSN